MECTRDISDDLLRIHRVLDTKWNLGRSLLRRLPGPLYELVSPPHRDTGVHQQLYQPFHLRRKVPRVPTGPETSHFEIESTAISSGCHHLICDGHRQSASLSLQAQPIIVVKLSRERSVGLPVRRCVGLSSALWKTANRIPMPLSRTGPAKAGSGVWQSVHGKGYFWGRIWGAPLQPMGTYFRSDAALFPNYFGQTCYNIVLSVVTYCYSHIRTHWIDRRHNMALV